MKRINLEGPPAPGGSLKPFAYRTVIVLGFLTLVDRWRRLSSTEADFRRQSKTCEIATRLPWTTFNYNAWLDACSSKW